MSIPRWVPAVGDRIAVYYSHGRTTGKVTSVSKNQLTLLPDKSYYAILAHPKQCRRLVKKLPREFWVNQYPSEFGPTHTSKQSADSAFRSETRIKCWHLKEVKKK